MTEPILKVVEAPSSYSIVAYHIKDLPGQYTSFIFSNWLRSLRYNNPLFKSIETNAYYSQYHAYITHLMNKPGSLIRVAFLTDDPDVLLGFSVSREDVLDYIYTQKDQRRNGIARKLYPEGITTMSHITLTAIEIWRKNDRYKHLKFNPFA